MPYPEHSEKSQVCMMCSYPSKFIYFIIYHVMCSAKFLGDMLMPYDFLVMIVCDNMNTVLRLLIHRDEASRGATRALAPPTGHGNTQPLLSPAYRHEEEEEGKEGREEEEEEAALAPV
jgi:hypothetical protein